MFTNLLMVTHCGGNKTNLTKNFQKAATWMGKGKVHPFTGNEALYDRMAHRGRRGIALPFLDHGTGRG
jgi:hypothetical protein